MQGSKKNQRKLNATSLGDRKMEELWIDIYKLKLLLLTLILTYLSQVLFNYYCFYTV